jgi:hypothetical protein
MQVYKDFVAVYYVENTFQQIMIFNLYNDNVLSSYKVDLPDIPLYQIVPLTTNNAEYYVITFTNFDRFDLIIVFLIFVVKNCCSL